MNSKYPMAHVGKHASLQGGYAYPSSEFGSIGVPVLKIKNVRHRVIDTSEIDYVSTELATTTSRFLVKSGDILISMTGSWPHAPASVVGRIALYRGPSAIFLINQRVGRFLVNDVDQLDKQYLFYALSSPVYQESLVAIASGSGNQANVSAKQIESLGIPMPSIGVQKSIAVILGALDDKIELNRQMNHTLEAMAQAIFKSWFVDFDPVTAKAEGRQPYGMNTETAALFPSRFVESELGPIPEGWEVSSIANLARYVNGKNFTKNATGTGRMVIRIAELNSGPGASTVYNEIEANEDNTAYPGDLLFSWSGSLDVYRWHKDEALVNQHIFKVTPQGFPQWFVYYQLREAISFFKGIAADKATTMGHIKREHLSQAKLLLPSAELIDAMDGVIKPMYQRIHQNERESITLASIRDSLLPRLLAGEIRVMQAEQKVAETA